MTEQSVPASQTGWTDKLFNMASADAQQGNFLSTVYAGVYIGAVSFGSSHNPLQPSVPAKLIKDPAYSHPSRDVRLGRLRAEARQAPEDVHKRGPAPPRQPALRVRAPQRSVQRRLQRACVARRRRDR